MKALLLAVLFYSASSFGQAQQLEFNCRNETGGTLNFTISNTHNFISFTDLNGFITGQTKGMINENTPMEITLREKRRLDFEYPWYFTSVGTIVFDQDLDWVRPGRVVEIKISFDDHDGYGFEDRAFGCVRAD